MKTYVLTNLNLTSGTVLGRIVEHMTYGLVQNAAESMQMPGNRRHPRTDRGSIFIGPPGYSDPEHSHEAREGVGAGISSTCMWL